jgi:phage tail protein X
VGPNVKTGTVTTALIVTVCIADDGPLHPAAVAVMMEVPDQPATNVTAPVEELTLFPPVILAASKLYVIPVVLVALAE